MGNRARDLHPLRQACVTNYTLYWRSFRGLLLRDLSVLRREVIPFLIRTVMNPLLFVFVFTYLFPKMGQGFQSSSAGGFSTLILPGVLAVGIFIQAIMATALPLSMEIGATREIHDRVMSPLPVTWVAIERLSSAQCRAFSPHWSSFHWCTSFRPLRFRSTSRIGWR